MVNIREMSAQEYEQVWHEISGMDSKTLFHEPSWLQYLERTNKGRPCFLELKKGPATLAYHVYLDTGLGPVRVMGSPLPGWTTNYLGPLFERDADQRAIVRAIKSYALRHGYLYVEIKNRSLDSRIMVEEGFTIREGVTTVLPLSASPDDLWKRMSGNARNRIRKAEVAGVSCDVATDRDLVDEYYPMIVERYAAQGLSFPFSIDRLYALWDCLMPRGRMIALRVSSNGQTVGAGLFPYDKGTIYYFGGASKAEFNPMCPNELMHWTVIKEATARGIAEYDFCGTSRFKRKFGTTDIPFDSYGYSPIPGMMGMRNTLIRLHRTRLAWIHAVRTRFGGRPATVVED